jgi:HK97 family phage prohead protease
MTTPFYDSGIRFAALTPSQWARGEGVAAPLPARAVTSPAAGSGQAVRKVSTSPGTLHGYAVRFDSLSVDLGGFRERIAHGAFDETLRAVKEKRHDITIQTEHDSRNLLGRIAAGNLTLSVDEFGLRFVVVLPNTTLARDTLELVRAGVLRGVSFGFSQAVDAWDRSSGGSVRTVKRLKLHEVSLVGHPAYGESSVTTTRSMPTPGNWAAARMRAIAARPHPNASSSVRREKGGVTWT